MNVLKMTDLDLRGKRVLIREDLNVPVKNGKVASDARIVASLPTIKLALEKGAAVMVMSHLGRPEEGVPAEEFSLAPVAARLSGRQPGAGWQSSWQVSVLGGADTNLNNAPSATELTLTLPQGDVTLPLDPASRPRSARPGCTPITSPRTDFDAA